MKKEEKEIIRHLIRKELECIKRDEKNIEFPQLGFLKSSDIYERELKKMLETLK